MNIRIVHMLRADWLYGVRIKTSRALDTTLTRHYSRHYTN